MAASTAIDPELVGRFTAALDRLNPSGAKIGLAVSGGPDSMAMLLLACEAIPGAFEVATVDHGLRPEAKDECALVVAACEERGVPCEVLDIAMQDYGGNLQAQARKARYRAIAKWAGSRNLAAIATAHHADDQAETLLMRANRGSGLSGMAGVRETARLFDCQVVRPLLDWRRSELRDVCATAGAKFSNDPSNADERFDRVRLRNLLAETDALDPVMLARSAAMLAEGEAFIETVIGNFWKTMVERDKNSYRYQRSMIPFANIELTLRIIRKLGGDPSRSDVARMVERLSEGENASLAGVLATVSNDWSCWTFRPEPPRRTV